MITPEIYKVKTLKFMRNVDHLRIDDPELELKIEDVEFDTILKPHLIEKFLKPSGVILCIVAEGLSDIKNLSPMEYAPAKLQRFESIENGLIEDRQIFMSTYKMILNKKYLKTNTPLNETEEGFLFFEHPHIQHDLN